jgi:hypothetical protein
VVLRDFEKSTSILSFVQCAPASGRSSRSAGAARRPPSGEQLQNPAGDNHTFAGREDVDVVRLHRRLILDLRNRHRGRSGQDLRQHAGARGGQVLHYDEGYPRCRPAASGASGSAARAHPRRPRWRRPGREDRFFVPGGRCGRRRWLLSLAAHAELVQDAPLCATRIRFVLIPCRYPWQERSFTWIAAPRCASVRSPGKGTATGAMRPARAARDCHHERPAFADKLLSAMRFECGGHIEKSAASSDSKE